MCSPASVLSCTDVKQLCVCVCFLSAVVVTLEPLIGAETYVNGKQITEAVVLKQGADAQTDSLPERVEFRWC